MSICSADPEAWAAELAENMAKIMAELDSENTDFVRTCLLLPAQLPLFS
jgi:hypothetical protein